MERSVCLRPKQMAPKYLKMEAAVLSRTPSLRTNAEQSSAQSKPAFLKRSSSLPVAAADFVRGALPLGRSASFAARRGQQTLTGEVWVVRHGETADNKTRTIAGHNAGGLSDLGRHQAHLLAERLRGTQFDAVYVSDLKRTQETANIVLETLPACAVHLDRRLREKGGGDLEGKALGTFERMAKQAGSSIRTFRAPGGGESWDDVAARSRSVMRDLALLFAQPTAARIPAPTAAPNPPSAAASKFPQVAPRQEQGRGGAAGAAGGVDVQKEERGAVRKVLVVTHGGFIRELLNAHVRGANATNNAKNCALFIVQARAGAGARGSSGGQTVWHLHLNNDASHIRDAGALGGVAAAGADAGRAPSEGGGEPQDTVTVSQYGTEALRQDAGSLSLNIDGKEAKPG